MGSARGDEPRLSISGYDPVAYFTDGKPVQGKAEFDEIHIEPEANPPVVLDGKASDFFAAIIEKNYSALPNWDPHLLSAWRLYVLRDSPMPREPELRPTI